MLPMPPPKSTYTLRNTFGSLPLALTTKACGLEAGSLYQTDCCMMKGAQLKNWNSPGSLVASLTSCEAVKGSGDITIALAQKSFGGGAASAVSGEASAVTAAMAMNDRRRDTPRLRMHPPRRLGPLCKRETISFPYRRTWRIAFRARTDRRLSGLGLLTSNAVEVDPVNQAAPAGHILVVSDPHSLVQLALAVAIGRTQPLRVHDQHPPAAVSRKS